MGSVFERQIRRHKDGIYRQMVRVCGSQLEAEDALGDALLAAASYCQKNPVPDHFRAWLTTIAVRCCSRMQIRTKLIQTCSMESLVEAVSPAEGEFETKSCILEALDGLTDETRSAFLLCEVEGWTMEAAAENAGLPVSTIKSRLRRARVLLRRALDDSLNPIQS